MMITMRINKMNIKLLMTMMIIIIMSSMIHGADMEDEDGSLAKASSEQFPSFSNFEQREFGMRKTNPFESSHQASNNHNNNNNDNNHNGDAENDGDFVSQQSQHFQTTMNGGNQETPMDNFREYGPSVYNMPHPGSDQNGQSQNQWNGQGQDGQASTNQEMGSFTPVSLSVEEAFRKYFPKQDSLQQDDGGYSQQQTQGQQQSLNGYSNNPQQQQQSQQVNDKEVVNIDSLREIVEKAPLAKPDPFDPPSPPLSAFLPPPPNSQLVESTVIGPSPSPPSPTHQPDQFQMNMNSAQQDQEQQGPRSQTYISQGPPPPMNLNQFKHSDLEQPRTQTYIQPPKTETFMYTKDSESLDHGSSSSSNNAVSSGNSDMNSEPTFGDEGDEEGYAYNTENLDENGRKISMVYARPVMPELGGKYDYQAKPQQSQQQLSPPDNMMNPIYRKPSYEDDKQNGADQQGPVMSFGDQYSQDRPYHNEITIEKPMDGGSMYPPPPLPPPLTTGGHHSDVRPPPSVFAEFNDYDQSGSSKQLPPPMPSLPPLPPLPPPMHHQQQQHQSSWSSSNNNNNMRPMDLPDGPQQIEYGGFVPIKKPMINNAESMTVNPHSSSSSSSQQHQQRERERDQYVEYTISSDAQKPPYEQSFGPNDEYVLQPRPTPSQQQMSQGPPPTMHQMAPPSQSQPPQSPPPQPQSYRPKLNLNFESGYIGPGQFNTDEPNMLYSTGQNMQINFMQQKPPQQHHHHQQQQPPQQQPSPNMRPEFHMNKIQNIHVKPLYGRDAMKKLRELGINEDEFYGTVNKILQKSRPMGKNQQQQQQMKPNPSQMFEARPQLHQQQLPPYMPKANLYRAPPKNRHHQRPGPFNAQKNLFFPSNMLAEDIELKFLKDQLPPGASYNPRDVGLDESVLAQIHLLDSGIGGYRFSPMHQMPDAAHPHPPQQSSSVASSTINYLRQMSRKPQQPQPQVPYKKHIPGVGAAASPHALNSMVMPFIFPGPNMLLPSAHRPRLPYSQTNTKGFYPVYGYRAAASELKPQFVLPNGAKPFKSFLNQPTTPQQQSPQSQHQHPHHHSVSTNIDPSLNPFLNPSLTSGTSSSSSSSSDNGSYSTHSFANIFGIRSIKGIKSLVSYLTGGVSG